jgi:hypothetical protein
MLVGSRETRQPTSATLKDTMNTAMINALLVERDSYIRRNLTERVKQVDAQLAAYGHKTVRTAPVIETATAEAIVETASKPAPKKRAAR